MALFMCVGVTVSTHSTESGYCNSWEHAGSSPGLGKPLPGSISREVPPGKPLPGTTYLRETFPVKVKV